MGKGDRISVFQNVVGRVQLKIHKYGYIILRHCDSFKAYIYTV